MLTTETYYTPLHAYLQASSDSSVNTILVRLFNQPKYYQFVLLFHPQLFIFSTEISEKNLHSRTEVQIQHLCLYSS